MNKSSRSLVALIVLAILIGFVACKKETSDPSQPAKTLNKNALTSKTWYNKGSSIVHEFKAGGVYGVDGSWSWYNNSDTLEIVMIKGFPKTYWKVYWNTDHEMSCEKSGGTPELYKDQAW